MNEKCARAILGIFVRVEHVGLGYGHPRMFGKATDLQCGVTLNDVMSYWVKAQGAPTVEMWHEANSVRYTGRDGDGHVEYVRHAGQCMGRGHDGRQLRYVGECECTARAASA
jgi:hypothetical protein